MRSRNCTAADIKEMAGIKRGTTSAWFGAKAQPKLANVRQAVEALGGRLVIVWDD